MSNLVINIHDIIQGVVVRPPQWLSEQITQRLAPFIDSTTPPDDPDFFVRSDSSLKTAPPTHIVPGPQHRFGGMIHDGRRGVFLLRNDKPDVGLFPHAPTTVLFTNRNKACERVYGMILLAIDLSLREQAGMIFHGVCLSHDGTHLVLHGPRGSCKTMVGLTLLKQGWDYTADDKFILHDGKAHLFEDVLGIRDHHIRRLPWLAERMNLNGGTRGLTVRHMMERLGRSIMPKRYITSWVQKWDSRHSVPVQQLFPQSEVIPSCSPDILVHLQPSDALRFHPFSDPGSHVAGAIQRMKFQDMHPLEDLLTAFCGYVPVEPGEILREHFVDTDTWQLETTRQSSPNQMAREIQQCLSSA